MREAIGQTFLFNLIIVFIGVIMVILIGAMTYSKTYKIKTKILDTIEKYTGYEGASAEIDDYLTSVGYKKNKNATQNCPSVKGASAINNTASQYHYCVYEYNDNFGKYYGVTTYIYFEFPIIGDMIEIPVYGETEVFYNETKIEG